MADAHTETWMTKGYAYHFVPVPGMDLSGPVPLHPEPIKEWRSQRKESYEPPLDRRD